MPTTRAKFVVCIDVDSFSGGLEDTKKSLDTILNSAVSRYKPVVTFEEIVQAEEANANQPELELYPVNFSKDNI